MSPEETPKRFTPLNLRLVNIGIQAKSENDVSKADIFYPVKFTSGKYWHTGEI